MIRLRRRMGLKCLSVILVVMLAGNVLIGAGIEPVTDPAPPKFTKIKLVQVENVGTSGTKLTKGSTGLGPSERVTYRIDLYDGSKRIDWDDLKQSQKNAIMNDLKCTTHNPLGQNVLTTSGDLPIDPNHKGGPYVSATTGEGQGAARIQVTSKDNPQAKALKLVTTGGIQSIQGSNVTPTEVTPTTVAPTQPDLFLPVMLGIGAAGAAAIAVGMAAGSLTTEEWYISTPSGYQRMGGAGTLGPYSSYDEAQSINRSYFSGNGRVYSKAGAVDAGPRPVWVK